MKRFYKHLSSKILEFFDNVLMCLWTGEVVGGTAAKEITVTLTVIETATESRHCGSKRGMMVHAVMMTLVCFQGVPVNLTGPDAVFQGKVHWRHGQEGWPLWWFVFITNTRWVKVFCRWQTLFFVQKCEEESVGQAGLQTGGRTLLHVYLLYFFLI